MTQEELLNLARTTAEKAGQLVHGVLGRRLNIAYLTIFAHVPEEYEQMLEAAQGLGERSEANNGEKFKLTEPLQTNYGQVHLLRIRKPDVYRPQLGCADFTVEDYAAFKTEELPKHPEHMRRIERPEYEMIEFFTYHPNDVLAYVVSRPVA